MASTQNSPVLVQHASPLHTHGPEVTVLSMSSLTPDINIPPPPQEVSAENIIRPQSQIGPEQDTPVAAGNPDSPDLEMPDAPADIAQGPPPDVSSPAQPTEAEQAPVQIQEEVPAPEPQSDGQTGPPPSPPPNNEPAEQPVPQSETPASAPAQEAPPEYPDWVTWQDDLSTPNEAEMSQIEAREEISALDIPSIEKRMYSEVDDPEQRPVKKLRLSWIIKGVRGTKEKPNHARVMLSPYAEVDGRYWQIKFYPRGNKSASLSAYIRCSKTPPKTDADTVESTFAFFEGTPETTFGSDFTPTRSITTVVTPTPTEQSQPTSASESPKDSASSQETSQTPTSEDSQSQVATVEKAAEEDWRVSAQIGMAIYNPTEPRSNKCMRSEHQFTAKNDDWGWTNFCGPWDQIHLRTHGERKPLLQDDTIAIDAYIRIFDDPSQSLWWHQCDSEPHWPSKSLSGYYPMGTPRLYHSPGVAGLASWLLLAPFRQLLQRADADAWKSNPQIRPRHVLRELHQVLGQMRELADDLRPRVDVNPVIQALETQGEAFTDVVTFWDVLRRALELEFETDDQALSQLRAIFDISSGPFSIPALPVESVSDVQQGINQVLRTQSYHGDLPDFLPLSLERQKFDKRTREWKLLHDRIELNDEIDVSEFTAKPTKYVLYGFINHEGERNSGKFYSILRPNGPNTKWLAFDDGNGNKIYSYTRKQLQGYEGLEGQALKDFHSTRETACMAMYIKADRLGDYLPGSLEPFKPAISQDIEPVDQDDCESVVSEPAEDTSDVTVDVIIDLGIHGRDGPLDFFNIKRHCIQAGKAETLTVSAGTTYQELRQKLCLEKWGIDDPLKVRFFKLLHPGHAQYPGYYMQRVQLNASVGGEGRLKQPNCLLVSLLEGEDVDLFGQPDHPKVEAPPSQPLLPQTPSSSSGETVQTRTGESDSADATGTDEPTVEPWQTPEAPQAAQDEEQASVQQAVAADLERVSAAPGLVPPQVESTDPDTEMQVDDAGPATDSRQDATDVPHGHLVDAAMHDEASLPPATTVAAPEPMTLEEIVVQSTASPALPPAQEAVVRGLIGGIGYAEADLVMSNDTASADIGSAPAQKRPVDHAYGFIRLFDAEKQSLALRDTFFARYEAKVCEFIQQRLKLGADEEFKVWRWETADEPTCLDKDATFQQYCCYDGATLVVTKPLSEEDCNRLEREGRFTTPYDLYKYARMRDRKHPIKSKTTTEPVEIAEFGSDYFKGLLVNGQRHGETCTWINSEGDTYEGPLVRGKKSGAGGKMTYQNGDTYDGDWLHDVRHGQGTFIEARTGNKYVGGFEYGKRWGTGTTFWQVADEEADLCQICASEDIDALFFDCGHVCSCVGCARQCKICPICRRTVKQVVKMFRA